MHLILYFLKYFWPSFLFYLSVFIVLNFIYFVHLSTTRCLVFFVQSLLIRSGSRTNVKLFLWCRGFLFRAYRDYVTRQIWLLSTWTDKILIFQMLHNNKKYLGWGNAKQGWQVFDQRFLASYCSAFSEGLFYQSHLLTNHRKVSKIEQQLHVQMTSTTSPNLTGHQHVAN